MNLNACVLLSTAIACGGSDGAASPNSASAMREVTAGIYDSAEAGGDLLDDSDLSDRIHAVMLAFGVSVESDIDVLDELYAARTPIFLEPQTYDLAAAFMDGGNVSLDDFVAAAAQAGATREGGGELTRAYLDEVFGEIAGKDEYTVAESLPAFVLALSAERAARYGGDDPLWGDGLLDPLQVTLLLYAVTHAAGAEAAEPPAERRTARRGHLRGKDVTGIIFEFTLDRIVGQLEGKVVEWVEWPTGPDDLAQSALCVSLLLYGHKLTVTASPSIIFHEQFDLPTPPAHATNVKAELIFMDDYYWNSYGVRSDIARLGCTLPKQGPVPNKPIAWGTSASLVDHGSYDIYPPRTDDDGESTGRWSTVVETTPVSKRTPPNQKSADGWVLVRASEIVPGWNTLARAVGVGDDAGVKGDLGMSELSVLYYEDPCLAGARALRAGESCMDVYTGTAKHTFLVDGEGYRMTADLTWTPVVSDPDGTLYEASGTVTYEHFQAGCTVTVDPATVPLDIRTGSSDMDVLYGSDPVTYTGSGSMFWNATLSFDCVDQEPGSGELFIGGGYFGVADPTEMTSPGLLSGDYTMDSSHYEWSFQRGENR
jgi:hypothetical protein